MFNTLSWIFVPFGILRGLSLGVVKVLIPKQAVLNLSPDRQFYFPPL